MTGASRFRAIVTLTAILLAGVARGELPAAAASDFLYLPPAWEVR